MIQQLDYTKQKNEHKLLLLCSRCEMNEKQEEEVQEIFLQGFDEWAFLGLALRHKVLQLATQHMIRLDKHGKIDLQFKRLIDYFYNGNKERNLVYFNELKLILREFHAHNIKAVPLKGLVLTPTVYRDLGLRTLNDLDFLISVEDKPKVSATLKAMGYQIGDYNWETRQINLVSRQEELMWRMHIGNLYPHVKLVDNNFAKCVRVDFSYDVDLKKNYTASSMLLKNSIASELFNIPVNLLTTVDFLIHIAIHLYKEATNVQWVLMHRELNLIKFCDLREYVLANLNQLDWQDIVRRARELKAEEALFYSFYFLHYLYGDDFSNLILKELNITDMRFLNQYGENDYKAPRVWRKSFAERFFSLTNDDEIDGTSKLESFKETIPENQ